MKKRLVSMIIVMMFVFSFFGAGASMAQVSETPSLEAESAVLMDASTGEILYDKKMDQQQYPASTTKIMTALLALENLDLDDEVTVSASAAAVVLEGANLNCVEGEIFTVQDLIYGLMLHSANEMAVVLAEAVSDNVEDFADLMNARAMEIGCKDTHFNNPNGLPDTNHYTTAQDLALITLEAMKNPTFAKVVSTKSYTIPATNKSAERQVKNSNYLLSSKKKVEIDGEERQYKYKGIKGVKTGYTNAAQGCLVEDAERNGLELLCVTLHSANDMRYPDAIKLLDWGFENYTTRTLLSEEDTVGTGKVEKGSRKEVDLVPASEIRVCVEKSDSDKKLSETDYTYKINEKVLTAPVKKGAAAGTLKIYRKGRLIGVYDLKTKDAVELSFWRKLLAKL